MSDETILCRHCADVNLLPVVVPLYKIVPSVVANSMHRKDYPYSLLFNPPIYSSEVQIYYFVKLALSHNPANRAVLWPIEFLLYNIFANELYSRKRYLDDTTRHETWSKTLTGR